MKARQSWFFTRSKRRSRIWTILLTATLIQTALFQGAVPAQAQGRPATVGVATVEMRDVSDTQPVIGQFVAALEARIATRTPGIIADAPFSVGDYVRRGDVLVRLETARLELERRSAQADVQVAEAGRLVAVAELRRAEQVFERQANLRSRNSRAFSRSRYEETEQDAARARASLTRAVAQLRRAEATVAEVDFRIKHAQIVAPFDGVVIAKTAAPGAFMAMGAAVATVMDATNLEIEADVPVELLAGLKPGRKIEARLDTGGTIETTVRAIVPVQTIATRTRPVRFRMQLSSLGDDLLAKGRSVTLSIPSQAVAQVLAVPKDALVQAGRGWRVFVVADGKAVPKTVVIGASVGDRVTVKSGLEEGEIVVVRGNERLRPGQAVRLPGKPQNKSDGATKKESEAAAKASASGAGRT